MGHRFIGSHPDELEGGQPVEPGQFIDSLNTEAPKNKQLIDDGFIIEAGIPRDLGEDQPDVLTASQPDAGDDFDNPDDEEDEAK